MAEDTHRHPDDASLENITDPEELDDDIIGGKSPLRISRVFIPIVIGLLVVGYFIWHKFDPVEFRKISWDTMTAVWLGIGFLVLVGRHLSYSYRLWILSEKSFTFLKCIELIFIWEFSSAISPTNVGGSAVALLVLSRERVSSARTAVIVLYTVVADTFFFIVSLLIWFFVLGASILRPHITSIYELDHWGKTFLIGYAVMFLYGSFFAYALLIDPRRPKMLLDWITRGKLFGRYRKRALKTGNEFVLASREVVHKTLKFHFKAIGATIVAWSCRFGLLICVILAFVPNAVFDIVTQIQQYARIESMFVLMAFSPTPGGSGVAEFAVSEYLTDYVPIGIVFIVAFIWRILEYYSYLLIGAVVVPNWVRKIYMRRREELRVKADLQA